MQCGAEDSMQLHSQEINKIKLQSEQSDQSHHRETRNLQSGGKTERGVRGREGKPGSGKWFGIRPSN